MGIPLYQPKQKAAKHSAVGPNSSSNSSSSSSSSSSSASSRASGSLAQRAGVRRRALQRHNVGLYELLHGIHSGQQRRGLLTQLLNTRNGAEIEGQGGAATEGRDRGDSADSSDSELPLTDEELGLCDFWDDEDATLFGLGTAIQEHIRRRAALEAQRNERNGEQSEPNPNQRNESSGPTTTTNPTSSLALPGLLFRQDLLAYRTELEENRLTDAQRAARNEALRNERNRTEMSSTDILLSHFARAGELPVSILRGLGDEDESGSTRRRESMFSREPGTGNTGTAPGNTGLSSAAILAAYQREHERRRNETGRNEQGDRITRSLQLPQLSSLSSIPPPPQFSSSLASAASRNSLATLGSLAALASVQGSGAALLPLVPIWRREGGLASLGTPSSSGAGGASATSATGSTNASTAPAASGATASNTANAGNTGNRASPATRSAVEYRAWATPTTTTAPPTTDYSIFAITRRHEGPDETQPNQSETSTSTSSQQETSADRPLGRRFERWPVTGPDRALGQREMATRRRLRRERMEERERAVQEIERLMERERLARRRGDPGPFSREGW
ncbi:hypothetical protein BZA77DRAFT_10620 [Pyronema omphalodes]|nr:hypothetical protein BZA77DRAFT_10620 [Pyronema omphalodes]